MVSFVWNTSHTYTHSMHHTPPSHVPTGWLQSKVKELQVLTAHPTKHQLTSSKTALIPLFLLRCPFCSFFLRPLLLPGWRYGIQPSGWHVEVTGRVESRDGVVKVRHPQGTRAQFTSSSGHGTCHDSLQSILCLGCTDRTDII